MVLKVNGAAYPGIWVEKQVTFIKIIFNIDISALPAADLYELGTTTGVSSGTVADGTFNVVESVLVQTLETLETNSTVLGISAYALYSYASAAGATSSGATVTVGSTAGLYVGMTVTVTAGTGTFAAGTTVIEVINGTSFTASSAPSVALSGGSSVVTGSGAGVDVMLGYAESWFSDATGNIATGLPVTNGQAVITVAGSAAADSVGTLVTVTPTSVTYSLEFSYFNGTMPIATLANGGLEVGPGATSGAFPTNSPVGQSGYYPVGSIVS